MNKLISHYKIKKNSSLNSIFDIFEFDSLNSTNTYAKRLAKEGADEGTVIVANSQTNGYGRRGRDFFSPETTGLYMTLILRPKFSATDTLLITTAAAVAVSEAIEEHFNKKACIKWVNDIFIDNKKVSGILTEAEFGTDKNTLNYAIVGIGVNIHSPESGFPSEISDIAGSITNEICDDNIKPKLLISILLNFWKYYEILLEKPHLDAYRKRCIVPGRNVTLIEGEKHQNVFALSIEDDFKLKIQTETGDIRSVSSAEVSIKL